MGLELSSTEPGLASITISASGLNHEEAVFLKSKVATQFDSSALDLGVLCMARVCVIGVTEEIEPAPLSLIVP